MATYNGTPGDDTYTGTADADVIYGNNGYDTLEGAGGNDTIDGGTEADVFVYRGNRSGYDVTQSLNGNVVTYVIKDIDLSDGDEGTDTLIAGSGDYIRFRDVTASVGVDVNNNVAPILGQPGITAQNVADNSPFAYQFPLNSFIDLNPGDTLWYSAKFADTGLPVPPSGGWLNFDPSTRTFTAAAGSYPLVGHNFGIIVSATDQGGLSTATTLSINVNEGQGPTIIGTDGNDVLIGTARGEQISGGFGADVLRGLQGNDVLDGGDGYDTIAYDHATVTGVFVELEKPQGEFQGYVLVGNGETDVLIGIENVIGTKFNDVINGSNDRNSLIGGAGDDEINGRDGDDRIEGGDGNDKI